MSSNAKKTPKLTQYLEQLDHDMYQVFDDLCLFSLFRVKGSGLTFLYPTDAKYRRKIINKAYSNNPEDAVDMIKSLVLLDFFPTPTEFSNKRDDVPNAHRKKLGVVNADTNTVTLTSGHTLTVDKNFTRFREADPVAVYLLEGDGILPIGEDSATMKYANTRVKRQTSSKQHSPEKDLAAYVEKLHNKDQYPEIYRGVMGLIYGCVVSGGNSALAKTVYNKICALDRASFYSIVAPYNLERNYDISTVLENSGICNLGKQSASVVRKALSQGNSSYNKNLAALVELAGVSEEDRVKQRQNRDTIRTKVFSMINNPIDAKTVVTKTYGKNVARLYKDLLTMYCFLSEIEEVDNRGAFSNFVFNIKNVFNHNNSFTKTTTETGFALTLYYNLIKSDAFLYIPTLSREELTNSKGVTYASLGYNLPEPNDTTLFSIQFNDSPTDSSKETDDLNVSYFSSVIRGPRAKPAPAPAPASQPTEQKTQESST